LVSDEAAHINIVEHGLVVGLQSVFRHSLVLRQKLLYALQLIQNSLGKLFQPGCEVMVVGQFTIIAKAPTLQKNGYGSIMLFNSQ
jgi:hypothetical protein